MTIFYSKKLSSPEEFSFCLESLFRTSTCCIRLFANYTGSLFVQTLEHKFVKRLIFFFDFAKKELAAEARISVTSNDSVWGSILPTKKELISLIS